MNMKSSCTNVINIKICFNLLTLCVEKELRDKMWKNLAGLWECSDCGYTSPKTSNVRNHIEVNHIASQGYYCQECNKFCRSKNSLNIHKSRYKH